MIHSIFCFLNSMNRYGPSTSTGDRTERSEQSEVRQNIPREKEN